MGLSSKWNMTDNIYANSVISNDASDVASFQARIQTPLLDRYIKSLKSMPRFKIVN